ncbi:MAG TPA: PHB depolymerase family esterase [Ktedonobacteraceae bacterium]|nr:PHB depolymerase family esterase [Ktedonobacteraceae bacterium]
MFRSTKVFIGLVALGCSLFLPFFARTVHASSGTFQQYTYNGSAGSRPYYVYTPANYQVGTTVPMIVMLHGCTQNPTDFAAGTQMNALADQKQFIVVYPQQTSSYNSSDCWNWFQTADQARGSGEPAIIAGIAQTVEQTSSQWTINPKQVYVAGMSAGAAMSVIMGATYPDIFAAIGVESGLEYQAATSLTAASTAQMQGGPNPAQQGQAAYNAMGSAARVVPTIVFHGTSDYTVYPVNGDQVVQQWMQTDHLASNNTYNASFGSPTSTTNGQAPNGGRTYTVQTWSDNNGNEIQEYWKVNGMGHAWSGGSSSGSYTDPQGPSATQAMYNFFMNHSQGQGQPPQTPTVSASPAGGTYSGSVQVTLTASPSSATIYYTTDGSTPTTSSSVYSAPLTISQTTSLKYIAVANGHSSAVGSQTYTIGTPTTHTLTLASIASEDGYIYPNDGVPQGSLAYLQAGSTPLNQAEVSIVSFDTSQIPAGSTVTNATLTLYRYDPYYYLGDLGSISLDIAPASGFNGNYALEQADYNAPAAQNNVGYFNSVPTQQNQAATDTVASSALAFINLSGHTQFRVHFQLPTSNKNQQDVMDFYSGDSGGAYVPVLTVQYR